MSDFTLGVLVGCNIYWFVYFLIYVYRTRNRSY